MALTFISYSAAAHTDFYMQATAGKVHIEYQVSWPEFPVVQKAAIFSLLAERMMASLGKSDISVYVRFENAYKDYSPVKYELRIAHPSFRIFFRHKDEMLPLTPGICIEAADTKFNMLRLLQAVEYGAWTMNAGVSGLRPDSAAI